MNGSRDLGGVHGTTNTFDLECARLVFTPGHAVVSIMRSSCVTWCENPSYAESSTWISLQFIEATSEKNTTMVLLWRRE